ncbi:hypothetical protein [Azohydromonas caseinilytica]|uniref:Uncharacterized protein n=1 Tax=Azohydromonas caseinilytica TaxID=2728836 RepID=A0A848F9W6_9BURK|nr:hypothetical protein [Azohydromonas caseinilytica]NML15113.1 hypothetical protein [Azohydromonas caseinilytica]
MSEYQYYELAAIDRPLTREEMAQLRAVSTRAEITPTGFVNHYEWGDLKADPAEWMRRYFDAFVYVANWCSCRLSLRVPRATFGDAELEPFAVEYRLNIEATEEHWIFDWSLDESEDDDRFAMDDGSGWMRRLAPLREELLRGDLRPLYLGWLAGAASGDLEDDAAEPPVPPGLAALSPAQQALVEFLEIDPDLLAAAQAGSAPGPRESDTQADADLDEWLAQWPREDMVAMLKLLAQGRGAEAERQVRSRHEAWLKARRPSPAALAPQRSVAELYEVAEVARGAREAREAKERAAQQAEQQRQREAHLRRLMDDVDRHWAAIKAQAERGTGSGYEQAVQMLTELEQAHQLAGRREVFDGALQRFMERHGRRTALRRRLSEAGLWS